jgi:hypothetical protein
LQPKWLRWAGVLQLAGWSPALWVAYSCQNVRQR